MSITLNVGISLGSSMTGFTDLRAKLYDESDVLVGSAFSTTFTEIGNGNYTWTTTTALTGFRYVEFYSNAAPSVTWAYTFTDDDLTENPSSGLGEDENTVSGRDILFKIAADAGEMMSEIISTVTSQTVLIPRGISRDPHVTLKHAMARIGTSSGIRSVSAWNYATQTLTLSSGFDVTATVGMVLDVVGADGHKRGQMFDAANEAIRAAYPFWYREVVVDAADSEITLATGTNAYALPADVTAMIAIGIQSDITDPIQWLPVGAVGMDFFTIEGQEGNFAIRFYPRFTRNGSFADEYNGANLCVKYAVREPELASESSTTQLPLAYFSVGSEAYVRRSLRNSAPDKIQIDALAQQQLREVARNVLGQLGLGKEPPNPIIAKAYAMTEEQPEPKKQKQKAEA